MDDHSKLDTPRNPTKRERESNKENNPKRSRIITDTYQDKYYLQKYLKYKSKYLDLQAEMKKLSLI